MKLTLSLLLSFLFWVDKTVSAQPSAQNFTLKVKIKPSSAIEIGMGEAHFLKGFKSSSERISKVTKGDSMVIFSGNISYPTGVRIYGSMGEISFNELLFIEPGEQQVELIKQKDALRIIQRPDTKIEKEYMTFQKFTGLKNPQDKIPPSTFLNYVKANPSSYVALFFLIDQAFNHDLHPEVKKVIEAFSDSVRRSKGLSFFNTQYFPDAVLKDAFVLNEDGTKVPVLQKDTKDFLFIDFWFTGCAACYTLMEKIKTEYYPQFSDKVTFLNINTDEEGFTQDALNIHKKLDLPWTNYWDPSATVFSKYRSFYKYPCNILLDKTGRIIANDIDIAFLKDFVD